MMELLINYSITNNYVFEIHEKDENGNYPLLYCALHNNIEMMKLLMEYSNKYNIILEINEKNNRENYPILTTVINNNTEMVRLLIDYANKNRDNIMLEIKKQSSYEKYPILWCILNNNVTMTNVLIDYANIYNIIIEIKEKDLEDIIKINNTSNEKNIIKSIYEINFEIIKLMYKNKIENKMTIEFSENSEILEMFLKIKDRILENEIISHNYSILRCIDLGSEEMMELLVDYAIKNRIALKINEKSNCGNYPFLWSTHCNNIKLTKLLIEYGYLNDNNIETNFKKKGGNYPLLNTTLNNNFDLTKLLIDYALKNNIILNINDQDKNRNYPLLWSMAKNNIKIVKLLIDYADKNNIILIINKKNNHGDYPILWSCYYNNMKMMKLIFYYSIKNDITLRINEKNNDGNYPIFWSTRFNNIEMTKYLIDYGIENNIILQINEINKDGNYPLLWSTYFNNIKMCKVLMEYSRKYNIILQINKKNKDGDYPLLYSIAKNNVEMTKLLIDYANQYDIILDISEEDIIRVIKTITIKSIKYISELDIEIVKLLYKNLNTYKMNIAFSYNSKILKLMEKINKNEEIINYNLKTLSSTLVVATNNFIGNKYDHLDIKKDELLIVTDWNSEDGWVYGYRKNNKKEKGLFTKVFISICNRQIEEISTLDRVTLEYKLKFEEKVKNFLSRDEMKLISDTIELSIHRNNLFIDAYNEIMNKSLDDLKCNLRIKYIGEDGVDGSGLLRDFFNQIAKEIGNPDYSLFQYINSNSYELDINSMSGIVDTNHLKYFKFIGRIMGLAIINKQYLPVNFSPIIFKNLLHISLEFSDLEYIGPEIYKNLIWLKNNDGVQELCLTFEIDEKDCFGNQNYVELKPNGSTINVNDLNKNEYIELFTEYKLHNKNKESQYEALKQGFYEIIPNDIKFLFNELDLKLLLCGINEINVDDWEDNTSYKGFKKDDITIINFWKCIRDFDNENRIKLLIFATGNSQIPVTGFKDLQGNGKTILFTIRKIDDINKFPLSHTCANCIDLPPYSSYTILKQKLLFSISEGINNFTLI